MITPKQAKKYHNKWVELEVITKEGKQIIRGRLELHGTWVHMFKYWHTGREYFFKQRMQHKTEQIWFISITVVNYCEALPGGVSRKYHQIKKMYNLCN